MEKSRRITTMKLTLPGTSSKAHRWMSRWY